MTSEINYGVIDANFPVPGEDNDSQGFRDNFSAISAALAVAKTELTQLQTNAIIAADLATSSTTVQNNLQGSAIYNGIYYQMYGKAPSTVNVNSSGSASEISIANGPAQRFYLLPILNSSDIADGEFSHKFQLTWNSITTGKFAKMRLFFSCTPNSNNVYSVQLIPQGAGNLHYNTGYPLVPGTSNLGFTLGGESVDYINVTVAGSGYITVPAVQFTGATTHGWNTAPTASVKFKAVPTTTITDGGADYIVGDKIVINGQPDIILQVTNVDPGGVITSVSIYRAGSYDLPVIGAQATTPLVGVGSGALITINNGIDSVVVTNPGDGYTTVAPVVTIDAPGSGVQAEATAFLTSGTRTNSHVVEAWTMDGGANVYIDYIGEYQLG